MIPQFPRFAPLARNDKQAIEQFTRAFPPYSDFTFPSLWCWNLEGRCELSQLNDNLIVRMADYLSNASLLSFIGHNDVASLVEVLLSALANTPGHLPHLKLIPEHSLRQVDLGKGISIAEDPDNHDYVYSVEEMVDLTGGRYAQHRWKINRFCNSISAQVVDLDLTKAAIWRNMEIVYRTWMSRKGEKNQEVENDIRALRRLQGGIEVMDYQAIGVEVGGRLAAYAIVEFNHDNFATNLFEHADVAYPGIYYFLRRHLAMRLRETGCTYLNHQQDLGIEGLRTSKRRNKPSFFLKKYTIYRAETK